MWAEQEARRRGLRDNTYVGHHEAERKVAEAMAGFDEQVAEWERSVVQGRADRLWSEKEGGPG